MKHCTNPCHIIIGLLLSLLMLGGCAPFQPVVGEVPHLYRLEAELEQQPAVGRTDLTLLVSQPHAWPGYDSANMVYLRKPYQLEVFAKSQWVDTPARMFGPLLMRALEQSAKFRGVLQGPTTVSADVRLDTEIVGLQQEFTTVPSRIHLTLRAQLVDLKAGKLLASREFDVQEEAVSEDAYGGVVAANRAVRRALTQLVEFTASLHH